MNQAFGALLVGASADGAQVVTTPGNWSVVSAPAANTVASATKAAVAGVRHVATGVTVTFVAGAVAPTAVQVAANLRDGATGVGTVIWSAVLALPATAGAACPPITITDLHLVGSVNTAMTLEFTAAGGANTVEAVTLTGHDITA